MPTVDSAGVRINYKVVGEGPPLVLVHGYTYSAYRQWELPGWVKLLEHSHRLLLVDVRGHGLSGKPHTQKSYSLALMAGDVLAAMDGAEIEAADIMGYSMGAMITMELLLDHGERFDRAVLGGMGAEFPTDQRANCRDEERGPIPAKAMHWKEAAFGFASGLRHFDFFALRALSQSTFKGRQPVDAARLPEIEHSVLAVVGTRDMFCPGTRILEKRIPDCTRVVIAGRDHINVIGDPRFKVAVRDWLTRVPSRFDDGARVAAVGPGTPG